MTAPPWTSSHIKDGTIMDGAAENGSAWCLFVADCTLRDADGLERICLRALVHAQTTLGGPVTMSVRMLTFMDEGNAPIFFADDGKETGLFRALAMRVVDDQMSHTAHAGIHRALLDWAGRTEPVFTARPWDGRPGPVIELAGRNIMGAA